MKISKITKCILDVMYWMAVVTAICVPWIFRYAGKYYPNIRENYLVMCIIFSASGLLAGMILALLRSIFSTIIDGECFVMQNVYALRHMAAGSFGIAILSAVRLFFVITPATFVIIIVFFIAGLFSIVLSQVFEQAVIYKQENDFTI